MKFSSLHTHTIFSDGKGSVRDNIESAINKGFISVGMSDHSYTACDESYCMKLENYGNYQRTVRELKKEYEGKISVFCGIEKDYFSEIDRDAFDYVISSVHYVERNGIYHAVDHSAADNAGYIEAFSGNALDAAKHYFEIVVKAAEASRPDIIGHFDVINKFSLMPEDNEEYIRVAIEAALEASKYAKLFEINTGAIARGYKDVPYPCMPVLKRLCEANVPVIITSDSHDPRNLDFAYDKALDYVRAAGYDRVYNLTDDGFVPFII